MTAKKHLSKKSSCKDDLKRCKLNVRRLKSLHKTKCETMKETHKKKMTALKDKHKDELDEEQKKIQTILAA